MVWPGFLSSSSHSGSSSARMDRDRVSVYLEAPTNRKGWSERSWYNEGKRGGGGEDKHTYFLLLFHYRFLFVITHVTDYSCVFLLE